MIEQRVHLLSCFVLLILFIAAKKSTGEVIVCTRGDNQRNTGYIIPNGQKAIRSLVVQPNGNVELFANGESKWTYAS